eukprot:1745376-Pleurochrysis_carterae.AAC.2
MGWPASRLLVSTNGHNVVDARRVEVIQTVHSRLWSVTARSYQLRATGSHQCKPDSKVRNSIRREQYKALKKVQIDQKGTALKEGIFENWKIQHESQNIWRPCLHKNESSIDRNKGQQHKQVSSVPLQVHSEGGGSGHQPCNDLCAVRQRAMRPGLVQRVNESERRHDCG